MIKYPVGWDGVALFPDEKTAGILLIVKAAGKDISYKYAAELVDCLKKGGEDDEQG